MEKLRIFLNSLTVEEQKSFATLCGTSLGYLRKAISEEQVLGAELSVLIEKNSKLSVTRIDLHPDKYLAFWPELAAVA